MATGDIKSLWKTRELHQDDREFTRKFMKNGQEAVQEGQSCFEHKRQAAILYKDKILVPQWYVKGGPFDDNHPSKLLGAILASDELKLEEPDVEMPEEELTYF